MPLSTALRRFAAAIALALLALPAAADSCSPLPALEEAARAGRAVNRLSVDRLDASAALGAAMDASASSGYSEEMVAKADAAARVADRTTGAMRRAGEAFASAREEADLAKDWSDTCQALRRIGDNEGVERIIGFAAVAGCYADAAERGETGLPECLRLGLENSARFHPDTPPG